MISTAERSAVTFKEFCHLAGPNPAGSKLSDDERLELLDLVARMTRAILADDFDAEAALRTEIRDMLTKRGLRTHQIADVFRDHLLDGMISLVDALCVHPAMKTRSEI